jgi:hypothetical protein
LFKNYFDTIYASSASLIDTKYVLGEEAGSTIISLLDNETLNVAISTNSAHTAPYTDDTTKTLYIPQDQSSIIGSLASSTATYLKDSNITLQLDPGGSQFSEPRSDGVKIFVPHSVTEIVQVTFP